MPSAILGFQLLRREDPLANVKSFRAWAATVPRNDPVGAVESLVRLLESRAIRSDHSAWRLHAIMELDRIAVPLQDHLRLQYRQASMSDDVRQRLFQACDALALGLAVAYGDYAKQIAETGEPARARGDWHGIFARLFHYIGVQTRQGLFRYEQWIPGRWRGLHQMYLAARAHGSVNEPFMLDPARPADQASPEQEYIQILLLHRLNTGNLTAQQIDWAAECLRDWVPALRLAAIAANHEPGTEGFWLDVGHGAGLRDQRPVRPENEVFYLDMEPLRTQLRALIGRLATQSGTVAGRQGPGDGDDLLTLSKKLDRLWLPLAPAVARRGERREVRYGLTVAAGWSEITLALTARHVRSGGAPAGYRYDDYGRLRNDKELGRPSSSRKLERDSWQVFDTSDSGFRIRSTARQAARQGPGALLALQVEDHPGWQLGIVRRLKRLGAEVTELGVEVISRNVSLANPREIEKSDSGYSVDGVDIDVKAKTFQALYLPPQIQSRVRTPASLVIQPAEFSPGRRLSLTIEGNTHDIMLASPLERTREWVWTPLRSGGAGAGRAIDSGPSTIGSLGPTPRS